MGQYLLIGKEKLWKCKKLKYKNLNEILKDCFQMSLFFKKLKKTNKWKKIN